MRCTPAAARPGHPTLLPSLSRPRISAVPPKPKRPFVMDGHETCAEGLAPAAKAAAAPRATSPPADADASIPTSPLPPGFERVLIVEAGWGCDQHGQNATKAAVRACRNAIEFNSLPIRTLIPGGVPNMRVHVKVAVPRPETVDESAVRAVFPYGQLSVEVVAGGMEAPSYIALAAQGDTSDAMLIAVAAVTVGHGRPAEPAAEVPEHQGFC